MQAGPEAEFFLFQRRDNGEPTTETHDSGGYFDLTPVDLGEDVRREIVLALEQMGFHVEAAHHEVAPGQHEIDFRHDDALTTADNVGTFRFIVKNVANRNGLHATFMPKPIFGVNGSGMHTPGFDEIGGTSSTTSGRRLRRMIGKNLSIDDRCGSHLTGVAPQTNGFPNRAVRKCHARSTGQTRCRQVNSCGAETWPP